MMPCSLSMRACATEPAMSWRYIFLSTGSDAPKRWVNSLTPCSNLPDHNAMRLIPLSLVVVWPYAVAETPSATGVPAATKSLTLPALTALACS